MKKMNINALDMSRKIASSSIQKKNDNSFEIGEVTGKTSSSDNGERIGLFTVDSTVYIATYADNSTPANPLVKVGDYEVEVNKVDPENATELEMFALLSHMDKTNQMGNKGICSFGKMRSYADIAQKNGFCNDVKNPTAAYSKKQDWKDIIATMKNFFASNKDTYKQSMDCENLLFGFSKIKNKNL